VIYFIHHRNVHLSPSAWISQNLGHYQNIWVNIACIGVITFLFSYFGTFLGFKVGSLLKEKLGNKVEIIGGIILILLGLKILIEHLFF
jgi:putative Mn2+ efflux pump MntP